MAVIRQLPPEVANKIAAGEVVERPASVVKELVENAIDAGAKRIAVELMDAGKQLIRVVDDGCGMEADDLALCFLEHATSKIEDVDDLFAIATMGFRGEALPSIGSISEARVVSRTPGAAQANEIINRGGAIEGPRPASGAPGTTVEIANLFYNTPVRRKFLRQNASEIGHVVETMQRMALGWPQIGFSLTHEGRVAFDLPPGQTRRERILAFAGSKLANDLVEINDFDDYAALTGFAGGLNQHRPNSKDLMLFVNRRFIRDRSLMQAVLLAYREFIPHGRYPAAWLFLDLDPSEVDINVHPTKVEVRFTQANRLFGKIKAAVQEAVLRTGQLPRLDLADRRFEQVKALAGLASQAEGHAALARVLGTASPRAPLPEARPGASHEPDLELATPAYDSPEHGANARNARALLSEQELRDARPFRLKDIPAHLRNAAAASPHSIASSIADGRAARGPQGAPPSLPESAGDQGLPGASDPAANNAAPARQPGLLPGALGFFQVGNSYIVVETADGLVLIDQHAYHERILYWHFEHRIASAPPERQRLLVPEPLELSRAASEILEGNKDAFRAFGFEIEPFGAGGWACYAVPRFIRTSRINDFVRASLEELATSGRARNPQELRKSLVDMMACKAAIKAGDALTGPDIEALLAEGAKVPHTFACPHGRPTTYKLTFSDLEKIFHRR